MRWIRLGPQAKAPGIGAFIHGRSQGARKTAGTTIIFISDVLGSLSCDNCFDMMSPTSVAYRISSFLRSRALGTCRSNLGMAASNTSTSFSLGKCYRCDRPTKRIFQCHGSPSERRQMTPVPRALQLRRMLRLACPSPPRRMTF